MFGTLFLYQDWALLLLRLALGAAFAVHGYPKLFRNRVWFAGWLDSIGIRPGIFWALVVGVAEFFGGIAVAFGVFTQIAAALIAVDMIVAMVKVKWGKAKFVDMEKMGWELDLIYLAACAILLTFGPGMYAIDSYLFLGY